MEFDLIRSERKTIALEIRKGRLIVRAPIGASDEMIRDFLRKNRKWAEEHLQKAREQNQRTQGVEKLTREELRALAEAALKDLPERVRHFAPLVGVSYGGITIRAQKTKWGSCSAKGNLNFNCLLMLAPPQVRNSVVVHELCHLKEMNHSSRFYAEVLRVFPDYRQQEKWLKENGTMLMARLPEP